MMEMIERLIQRRDSLKEELARGKELVSKKEAELADLRKVIVRLEGAIQVLDETVEEMRKEDSDQ